MQDGGKGGNSLKGIKEIGVTKRSRTKWAPVGGRHVEAHHVDKEAYQPRQLQEERAKKHWPRNGKKHR